MSYSGDGTVLGANDSVNGSWTHSYDDLGRILTSTQSGGSAFTFGTDHYGNRANQTLKAGSGPQPSFSVDPYTNKITTAGYSYDAVGNLTNDGIHAYKYDAENRIIGVDDLGTTYTARYKYDAAGRRVEKQVSGQDTIDYVYDSGSNAATRIDATTGGTWLGSEIFATGHLATYTGGTTYFELSDWLGSERVRTNVSGASVETCSNLAYGDNIAASSSPDCTGTDISPFHFTGYEHDNESGLDHAWFRYYNPRIGRFTATDLLSGMQQHPQLLNKSAYVANDPSSHLDPLGLCDVVIAGINSSSSNSAAITNFANSIGANLAFPYANEPFAIGGTSDVITQSAGFNTSATSTAYAAIMDAAQYPGPINVFTMSGGSEAFASAMRSVPAEVAARINNVTSVSPGGADLSAGNGANLVIQNDISLSVDLTITPAIPADATQLSSNCPHDSNCAFGNGPGSMTGIMRQNAGSACPLTKTFSRGGFGEGGGNWYFGSDYYTWWAGAIGDFTDWLNSIQIEEVTHKIVY